MNANAGTGGTMTAMTMSADSEDPLRSCVLIAVSPLADNQGCRLIFLRAPVYGKLWRRDCRRVAHKVTVTS